MQTQTITIQGSQFNVPAPFSEGYTLNAAEASAMNQLFAENVRNNFAGKMKKAEEKKETVPGQAELDKYCEEYKFGNRAPGQPKLDPVTSEAYKLATKAIEAALTKKAVKKKDLPEGQFAALVKEAVETKPHFKAQAEAIIKLRNDAIAAASEAA